MGADLRRSSAAFWNLLGERAASGAMAKSGKGITFNSKMEDGSPVLGTTELNERFVLFQWRPTISHGCGANLASNISVTDLALGHFAQLRGHWAG